MSDPHIGQKFDNYLILEKVGEGGMGSVYKARDVDLNMIVALKMLKPMLSYDRSFTRRFRSEAQSLARLNHPNIVRVLRLGENEHGLYIVMEFVEGLSLDQYLQPHQSENLPHKQIVAITRQVLQALGHAHQQRVIHRDIKPSNIMWTDGGKVKITDFGLAKIQTDGEATVTHVTAGTLHYMSPEQILTPTKVDHRSDLYAVGMTLYAMLHGKVPFDKTESGFKVQEKIVKGKIPPIREMHPDVPKSLAYVVMKALAAKPEQRFATAEDMLAALPNLSPSASRKSKPATPGRNKRWVAGALLIATLAAVALLLTIYPGWSTIGGWLGLGDADGPTTTTVATTSATRVLPALSVRSLNTRGDTLRAELVIGREGSGMYRRTGRYTPLDGYTLEAGRYQIQLYLDGYTASPRQEIVEINPSAPAAAPLTFTLTPN